MNKNGGLMVTELFSGSSSAGSRPDCGHCILRQDQSLTL